MSIESWIEKLLHRAFVGRPPRQITAKPEGCIGWDATEPFTPFEIVSALRLRHTYVLGSTGSGKTNLLLQLIEEDIDRGISAVVLDMRGDLIDQLLAQVGPTFPIERLHLIDLRNPAVSSGINPFQSTPDPFSSALQIHAILEAAATSWGVQLDETLRHSLIALSFNRLSLVELPRLLTDAGFRLGVVRHVPNAQTKEFFVRFDQMADKGLAWTTPVLNKVSPFVSHPAIRAILGERKPLKLAEVLDTPGTLFLISMAADQLHGLASTFGCLVVTAVENAVMSRIAKPEGDRNPVHLYLDEFENFQSPAFESIIAEGRRFRLGLTLSHQNLHQLDSKLRHMITNNAATRIYFRTGFVDAKELGGELEAFGVKEASKELLKLPVGSAYVIDASHHARLVEFREATRAKKSPKDLAAIFEALAKRTDPPAKPLPKAAGDPKPSKVVHVKTPRAAKSKDGKDAD